VTEALFPAACGIGSGSIDADLEADNSCWLVHHIGSRINRSFATEFPFGINVDFMRIRKSGKTIEYRCYERGINHETLACGTGAVAVTAVSCSLGFCGNDEIIVWPYRCRWQYPDSEFTVKRLKTGWYVHGTPRRLYQGHLTFFEIDSYLRKTSNR
jgi:diaminopimelate epimerase